MKDLIIVGLFLVAAGLAVKADMDRAGIKGGTHWKKAAPKAIEIANK